MSLTNLKTKQIVDGLNQIKQHYANLRRDVFFKAVPIYVFNKELDLFRPEYDEHTKALLEEINKQECEAIKELAKEHGIKLEGKLEAIIND